MICLGYPPPPTPPPLPFLWAYHPEPKGERCRVGTAPGKRVALKAPIIASQGAIHFFAALGTPIRQGVVEDTGPMSAAVAQFWPPGDLTASVWGTN